MGPSILTVFEEDEASPLEKATGANGLQEATYASEIPRQLVEPGWSKDQLKGMQREDQIPRIGRVTQKSTIGEVSGTGGHARRMPWGDLEPQSGADWADAGA
jgi:hypothetical protein